MASLDSKLSIVGKLGVRGPITRFLLLPSCFITLDFFDCALVNVFIFEVTCHIIKTIIIFDTCNDTTQDNNFAANYTGHTQLIILIGHNTAVSDYGPATSEGKPTI